MALKPHGHGSTDGRALHSFRSSDFLLYQYQVFLCLCLKLSLWIKYNNLTCVVDNTVLEKGKQIPWI